MRVTQGSGQAQFLAAVQQLESSLQTTQNHLSANQSFTTAAENPIGAGQVNGYNQALAQSQQYATNANAAQTNLQTEDNALAQVTTALQSLRSLTLQANTGTLSADNKRSIASQVQQIQQTLVGLANTQNGQGEYIFAGYATQTKPFSLTTTGASYSGDANQRQIQIAAGQTVADGDTGATVFNNIKTGNGTFQVTAGAANTGSGLIGATTVTDQTAYDGGAYTISFPTPATYQVTDATNNVVSTGAYADGDSIAFKGIQVTLTGTPAANDSFSVAKSTNQDIFTTVQNLASALSAATNSSTSTNQLGNLAGNTLNNIDQALNNLASVRATVGGRINTITAQQTIATSQQTQLKTNIANLQGLDYAAAITDLTQQNTTLQAALSAYTMTQGLSLFKYLQ